MAVADLLGCLAFGWHAATILAFATESRPLSDFPVRHSFPGPHRSMTNRLIPTPLPLA